MVKLAFDVIVCDTAVEDTVYVVFMRNSYQTVHVIECHIAHMPRHPV